LHWPGCSLRSHGSSQSRGLQNGIKHLFDAIRREIKDPRWAQVAKEVGFLREAEELLAKPKTPGGK
jgi:hypothetical protein